MAFGRGCCGWGGWWCLTGVRCGERFISSRLGNCFTAGHSDMLVCHRVGWSRGQLLVTWAIVGHVGNCWSRGKLLVTWAIVGHVGNCWWSGQLLVTWEIVGYVGNCWLRGQLLVTCAIFGHVGNCRSHGQLLVTWIIVGHVGKCWSRGQLLVTWEIAGYVGNCWSGGQLSATWSSITLHANYIVKTINNFPPFQLSLNRLQFKNKTKVLFVAEVVHLSVDHK